MLSRLIFSSMVMFTWNSYCKNSLDLVFFHPLKISRSHHSDNLFSALFRSITCSVLVYILSLSYSVISSSVLASLNFNTSTISS